VARIESVNVGKEFRPDTDSSKTGIYKSPVEGAVEIDMLGVAGDRIADLDNHGGPDQAVYCYLAEDYRWWSEKLGTELAPGSFGDNLTISGLVGEAIAAGDRFVAGEVTIEATAPRIPCNTLARRMKDPGFVKAFRQAERPGFYCRVIVPGMIEAGATVERQRNSGERVTILDLYRAAFERRTLTPEALRRMLSAPIAERVRQDFEALLAARV
jgi:MOSC domain-containing protein YiiM